MHIQEAPAEAGKVAGEEGERPASAEEEDYSMSPEVLDRRLGALRVSATFTVFDFTRRGLFDRDKLIVTCLLTLQVSCMLAFPSHRTANYITFQLTPYYTIVKLHVVAIKQTQHHPAGSSVVTQFISTILSNVTHSEFLFGLDRFCCVTA
jgi:hypothetical protein